MSENGAPKPNLIWHSNAPWVPTGYGSQTALFAPLLAEHFQLALSAFYGLQGNIIPWNGIPVLPGRDAFGNEEIVHHAQRFFDDLRDGLVVTLLDIWALNPQVWRKLNVACWCPVDHDPAPPNVLRFLRESAAIPIAMSRWGQKRLPDALYVPHAVDTGIFRPMPTEEARRATKLPQEAFVVGMVAANKGNPSRKCFPKAFQAFKAFKARHPEAILYLHTEIKDTENGIHLGILAKELGLAESIVFVDQYRATFFPPKPEQMAQVFGSMDVLLAISAGEGFGIPTLEAAACGVPAIVTDFSAQPEVAGDAGWRVAYEPNWVGMTGRAGYSWMADPDLEDTVEALEQAYRASGGPSGEELSRVAREHAEGYDIQTVFRDHMMPALAEISERLEDREPVAV